MLLSLKGCSRIVFFIGKYVIKIPNFLVCHLHFLQGCYGNWSERQYYKSIKNIENSLVAPSLFCFYFGLFQIQLRCIELDRDLTSQEVDKFKDICFDIKKENFGYLNNKLVCFDYA